MRTRRQFVTEVSLAGAALAWPRRLHSQADGDLERLTAWVTTLRQEGLDATGVPVGRAAARVGELAIGTPYVAGTLEEYLTAGGVPDREPLAATLTRFDCVTLVEGTLAVARTARRPGAPTWAAFGEEVTRIRYRDGRRGGYASRLHYFSEWIHDGARRGLVRDLGVELGGTADTRPLRFMSAHRASYPALTNDRQLHTIAAREQALDGTPRWVIPTARIPVIAGQLQSGDVLAFATSIEALDVTHTALVHRDEGGETRVLHAPLSGGTVEIAARPLPDYVSAIRRATGILVARPLV